MSVDMTKWQDIAREKVNDRPAANGRLAGKITIVTGAAQGFGRGIAEELHKEGAVVIIADMNYPLAKEVADGLGERGSQGEAELYNGESAFCWGHVYEPNSKERDPRYFLRLKRCR